MQARAQLEGLFSSEVLVASSGLEGGRAEVLVKAVKAGDLPFLSGGHLRRSACCADPRVYLNAAGAEVGMLRSYHHESTRSQ